MKHEIAAVIPCYRERASICDLVEKTIPFVSHVFVVDDKCPDDTGALVLETFRGDPRVQVITLTENRGVGGATLAGMEHAFKATQAEIFVKLDGDGQMDPKWIQKLTRPIRDGACDYSKANRFHSPRHLKQMPFVRLFGNSILSFITKLSTGQWHLMDPTNGFVAIHRDVFASLEVNLISPRYFFETDMLFRLRLLRAVVTDVPIPAIYGTEVSKLSPWKEGYRFFFKHIRLFIKRLVYDYLVRDFNLGSTQLIAGLLLTTFGIHLALFYWITGIMYDRETSRGITTLVVLTVLSGVQFLLGFINFDVANRPSRAIYPELHEVL